jgi:NAD(P)-dependent dehydrogenase (short-subunit alcohol dehydrogenase family)
MRLANRTALITGGNSGIGPATEIVVDGGVTGAPYGALIYAAATTR